MASQKRGEREKRRKRERKFVHVSGCEGENAREGMQAAGPVPRCGTEDRAC